MPSKPRLSDGLQPIRVIRGPVVRDGTGEILVPRGIWGVLLYPKPQKNEDDVGSVCQVQGTFAREEDAERFARSLIAEQHERALNALAPALSEDTE
jgi:hypothetical protein